MIPLACLIVVTVVFVIMHVRAILKDTISRAVSCFGLSTFVDRLLADRDEIDLLGRRAGREIHPVCSPKILFPLMR